MSPFPRRRLRPVAIIFGAVCLTHLGAELLGAETLSRVTQWAAMPLLAATLLDARGHVLRDTATEARGARGSAPREKGPAEQTPETSEAPATAAAPQALPGTIRAHVVRYTALGLGFSFLGDTLPSFVPEDLGFLAMVGMFALAQATYCVAFWPLRAGSVLRRPLPVLGYTALGLGVMGACAAQAGPLLPVLPVYAGLMVGMAVLSTGVHRLAGAGALLFVISDAMIGLNTFAPWWHLPAQGFWVMLTYLSGQSLIVLGVLSRTSPESRRELP